MPIGSLDTNGSGCHTTKNVNTVGFKIGAASISAPTLNVAGHTTVAAAIGGCQSMQRPLCRCWRARRPRPATRARRPSTRCIPPAVTATAAAPRPRPSPLTRLAAPSKATTSTTAPCARCHTTAGNNALLLDRVPRRNRLPQLPCASERRNLRQYQDRHTPSNHFPIGTLDTTLRLPHTHQRERRLPHRRGHRHGADSHGGWPHHGGEGGERLPGLPRDRSLCRRARRAARQVAGDSRPTAFDKAHPTSGNVQRLPYHDPDVHQQRRRGDQAHQPHPDQCRMHTVSHHRGQLCPLCHGGRRATRASAATARSARLRAQFLQHGAAHLVQPPSGATGHIPAVPPNGTAAIACELCHSPSAATYARNGDEACVRHFHEVHELPQYGMKWKTSAGRQLWVRDSPGHHAGQDCGGSRASPRATRWPYARRTWRPRPAAPAHQHGRWPLARTTGPEQRARSGGGRRPRPRAPAASSIWRRRQRLRQLPQRCHRRRQTSRTPHHHRQLPPELPQHDRVAAGGAR